MTDSTHPTHAQGDTLIDNVSSPELDEQQTAEAVGILDAATAQSFRMPTSLEASPDGNWLVWLQPGESGDMEMYLTSYLGTCIEAATSCH